ncbi:MAG: hypothetical protein JW882_01570 [Deltaproteobacteria bacterium]|nr:hypothetical protein [Deltaproteobacteria bacterium]
MKESILYFESPGKENTQDVMSLVKKRAQVLGINRLVLASTRGNTAEMFNEAFDGTDIKLIVIPWQFGFREGPHPFPQKLKTALEEKGHRVHFSTMLFHTDDFYGVKNPTSLANILRIFGQGIKVCVEILLMACDGGCIEWGEEVIAVAGTAGGADTAVVATAAPSTRIKQLKIHEIICKPLLRDKTGD